MARPANYVVVYGLYAVRTVRYIQLAACECYVRYVKVHNYRVLKFKVKELKFLKEKFVNVMRYQMMLRKALLNAV